LPATITADAAVLLPVASGPAPDGPWVLAGVGGDDLSQYRVGLGSEPGYLIAGQRRTGRSTALAVASALLADQGWPVLVVAPKPSPLTVTAAELELDVIADLGEGSATAIKEWITDRDRCAVVVDDADQVHGTPVDDVITDLARSRPAGGFALVVAAPVDDIATQLRGVAVQARRSRQGVLLSPASSLEGKAFGPALPRNLTGRQPPGRGVLLVDGEWTPVQLPLLAGTG
jgi:S-DNA-T family DNA segregation ATPase FtsK/SpoIIIE